jgi:hypothetical protein
VVATIKIHIVAADVSPDEAWTSRDPRRVARALEELGFETSYSDLQQSTLACPPFRLDLPAGTELVLSIGNESAVPAAVGAYAAEIPLVSMINTEMFLDCHTPAAYAKFVCGTVMPSALVVESPRQRELAFQLGARRQTVYVIPPGVERTEPLQAPPQYEFLVDLSRASLDESRLAMRLLADTVRSTGSTLPTRVLLGQLDIEREIAHWNLELRDQVQLVQITAPMDLAALQAVYEDCQIVVNPTATCDATAGLIRSIAAGRPILASHSAASGDVIRTARDGVLVRPERYDEWLDKLEFLHSALPLRRYLQRNGVLRGADGLAFERAIGEIVVLVERIVALWQYSGNSSPPARGD